MDISIYFKHWKNFTRDRMYDKWCDENVEWLVKEPVYQESTDFAKFMVGFKV